MATMFTETLEAIDFDCVPYGSVGRGILLDLFVRLDLGEWVADVWCEGDEFEYAPHVQESLVDCVWDTVESGYRTTVDGTNEENLRMLIDLLDLRGNSDLETALEVFDRGHEPYRWSTDEVLEALDNPGYEPYPGYTWEAEEWEDTLRALESACVDALLEPDSSGGSLMSEVCGALHRLGAERNGVDLDSLDW